MDTLRSKNSFDFESTDNIFPYGRIDGIEVGTRKFVLFNYSTTYFRRKQSGKNELDFIGGGNIPSDMTSSSTQESGSQTQDGQSFSISCSNNTGSAYSLGAVPASPVPNSAVINLSPNNIIEVPEVCDAPWPPSQEIIYEKAKQQKPNFIYFPAYQSSASTHPRARGYAHEDNYDCLKKRASGGGWSSGRSVCCDDFCKCFGDNNGQQVGAFLLEDIFGSDPPAKKFVGPYGRGLCCSTYPQADVLSDECSAIGDQNKCKFGFYMDLNSVADLAVKACPVKEIDGVTYSPMNATLTYVYQGGGNTNCGCNSGRLGKVTASSVVSCIRCAYQGWKYTLGIPTPVFTSDKKCTTTSLGSSKNICACIFNAKVTIGDTDIYFTSMAHPSFKYPDGQALDLTDDGKIVSKGCDGSILYSCSDVN
jgi:hypothetical protein